MKKLTQKQENFCLRFVELGNASEAYRQSYDASNMKAESINRKATEVMENVTIKARVAQLQAEARERNSITVDKIVHELARLGFSNIANLYDKDGKLKQPHELDEDTQRSISEITFHSQKTDDDTFVEVVKYKLHDKKGSLDLLMKHLGGYDKDNMQKANVIVIGANPIKD